MRLSDIGRLRESVNRRVVRVVAHLHTGGLWIPITPNGLRTRMEREYGRRVRIEPCVVNDIPCGWRAPLHRLSQQSVRVLAELQTEINQWQELQQRKPRAVMSWADLALDLTTRTREDADKVKYLIVRRLILNWCRCHSVRIVMNKLTGASTFYFDYENKRRVLTVYSDRKSIGGSPCCHIELRLHGAQSCQANDVIYASDLLNFDPAPFFDKHIRIGIKNTLVGPLVGLVQIQDRRRGDSVSLSQLLTLPSSLTWPIHDKGQVQHGGDRANTSQKLIQELASNPTQESKANSFRVSLRR